MIVIVNHKPGTHQSLWSLSPFFFVFEGYPRRHMLSVKGFAPYDLGLYCTRCGLSMLYSGGFWHDGMRGISDS